MTDKKNDVEQVDGPTAETLETEVEVTEAPATAPHEAASADETAAELEELRDRYLRLAADFDNFRKRTARDQVEARARVQGELLAGLLDSLDDLARVAHPNHEQADVRDVLNGVELVERKLLRQLESVGLERLGEVEGPFDPNLHEAVATVPAEKPEDDHTIAAVLQCGYRFHGQLLRPARVQVRIWTGDDEA